MPLDNRFLDHLAQITPVARDEPMAHHTTLQIGGPAAAYSSITDACRLAQVARLACQWEAPLFILGAGSNLLVSDTGIDALVVETWANAPKSPFEQPIEARPPSGARQLPTGESRSPAGNRWSRIPSCSDRLETCPTESRLPLVGQPPRPSAYSLPPTAYWVYAGAPLPRLAHQAATAGLSGLEWSAGIPGTVGGGVVNNAGAHGTEMSGVLRAVRVHDGREERVLTTDGLGYSYRASNLRRPEALGAGILWAGAPPVVLAAQIALTPAPKREVHARMEEFTTYRRNTQPSQRSIGSIFKNPPNRAAGWLIDQCGLKGRRAGDAEVSEKHGNFIVNRGRARAADVNELIQVVRSTVRETCGIELELEIQRVGRFD